MANRTKDGIRIATTGGVEDLGGGLYRVTGSGDRAYRVDAQLAICKCRDFEVRGGTCKHLYAVEVYEAKRRTEEAREQEVANSRAFFGGCMASKRQRSNARAAARWGQGAVVRGRS